jgi:uncharacterized membrane protein YkvA (DUF1232 family)
MKLETHLKIRTLESYHAILSEASSIELQYVDAKFKRVYSRLTSRQGEWQENLAFYTRAMMKEVDFLARGVFTEEGRIVIASAFYLCKPDDVIPDHTPGTGYLDDAFIINRALSDIKRVNIKLYKKIIKRVEKYQDGHYSDME